MLGTRVRLRALSFGTPAFFSLCVLCVRPSVSSVNPLVFAFVIRHSSFPSPPAAVSRALKFTLLFGVQISLLLLLIAFLGVMRPLDAALFRGLGLADTTGVAISHPFAQVALCVALAFGIAWTTIDINRPVSKILVAFVALAEVFTLSALLAGFDLFFSPLLPALAVALAFACGFIYSRSPGGRRQQFADTAFGSRVSPGLMRSLVDGRASLDAAGQLQELTLVVCEIFNHQQLMDSLEPAEYLALSNRFLHTAAEVLVQRGGCLSACDGEGARVIFGAPLPMAGHAGAACLAALEVARQLRALNEETARRHGGLVCDVRIGVNSGEMAAGYFGSQRLGGYGVAGEEVAFARRLCAANLIYGSTILIGARTYEMAESVVEARPLELLRRRVGDSWLEVYELLGEPRDLTPEDLVRRDLFWTGVIFYRERRLVEAMHKFQQARATVVDHDDAPLEFYINRIKQLQFGHAAADWETARLLNSL